MSGTDESLSTIARQWQAAVDDHRPDPIALLRDSPPAPRVSGHRPALLVVGVVVLVVAAAVILALRPQHHTTPALGGNDPTATGPTPPTIASKDIGHVSRSRRTGPLITVDVDRPCPQSLGTAGDVHPPPVDTAQHLVPVSGAPDAGLVCQYHGTIEGGATSRASTALSHSTALNATDAAELAAVISRMSLKAFTGTTGCPMERSGTITVIAFDYDGHTVDLWQNTSGCQTLDNGDLYAFEIGNPSFYDVYAEAFDRIVNH